MSKILYILDNNEKKDYQYSIKEDTIIYHFSINSSSKVSINLDSENVELKYYYNNINYDNNQFNLEVNHLVSNTKSYVFNHGVNVGSSKLNYFINGVVLKTSSGCICDQENQIINMSNGKSNISPNLLIDNYDVISNHSAYIGKFRDEVLFYLMSRGISRNESYRLLLNGFLINNDVEKERILPFIEEIKNI